MSWALLVKGSERLGLHPASPHPGDPLSNSQTPECLSPDMGGLSVGARLQSSAHVNMTLRPKLNGDKSVTNNVGVIA